MKTTTLPLSFCAAVLVLVAAFTPAGFSADLTPIFNGKDLAGWKVPDPNPFWKVLDGVLVGENDAQMKGHILYTEQEYGDFIFETEVRWTGEIDSGILFRKPDLQLQFGVSRSLKKDLTCSFYTGGKDKYPEAGQARNLEKHFKPNDWNKVRLQAKGDTFAVWLNGEKTTEFTATKYAGPGPIGLQIHAGLPMKVEFRNIKAQSN